MVYSLKNLPWVEPFLKEVQDEYLKDPLPFRLVMPSFQTVEYVMRVANEPDAFDTAGVKKECGSLLNKREANILHCISSLGEIIVVSLNSSPIKPSWKLWWRCVRLLNKKGNAVRILIFAHPKKRIVPEAHMPIREEHLNGGTAIRCNPGTIVLYRKEEVTRVLIHELFHASCSDPYHRDVPYIEADTEAWAELVLCAMAAKGQIQPWIRHMKEQIAWAVKQAATVQVYHTVRSPQDYAWRYLVGRLIIWRRLGIHVPDAPKQFTRVHSLRFSICEPKDE